MKRIVEGEATVRVPLPEKISAEMPVFYNPAMKLNRDVTLLILRALAPAEGWRVISPLAGSGVRECRVLTELDRGMVASVMANDYSEDAAALIRENIALNEERLNCDDIEVSCAEASQFLLGNRGGDYVDLDPFGSPNPFLDAACKKLHRRGLLAVTATDTSALAGTYPKACRRKYGAAPMRNHLMHEVGLRILVRKAQDVAAQYDKALIPVYSYAKEHYMRVFLRCSAGKAAVDRMLSEQGFLHHDPKTLRTTVSAANAARKGVLVAGPLWTGRLWDPALARKVASLNAARGAPGNQRFLDVIAAEAASDAIGFYPFNLVRKALKKAPRKKAELLERKGVFPTHLEGNAVRAEALKKLF